MRHSDSTYLEIKNALAVLPRLHPLKIKGFYVSACIVEVGMLVANITVKTEFTR